MSAYALVLVLLVMIHVIRCGHVGSLINLQIMVLDMKLRRSWVNYLECWNITSVTIPSTNVKNTMLYTNYTNVSLLNRELQTMQTLVN